MTKRKLEQLERLAKACKKAYAENPHLWFYDENAEDQYEVFDFPAYGGLPKSISHKLSSDCVDVIQGMDKHTLRSYKRIMKTLVFYKEHGYAIP